MRSPRLAVRYGIIWRSRKSSNADSESASVAAVIFADATAAGGFAIDCATVAGGGFSPGAAAEAATGVGGATAFGSTDGGAIVSAMIVDPKTLFRRPGDELKPP